METKVVEENQGDQAGSGQMCGLLYGCPHEMICPWPIGIHIYRTGSLLTEIYCHHSMIKDDNDI